MPIPRLPAAILAVMILAPSLGAALPESQGPETPLTTRRLGEALREASRAFERVGGVDPFTSLPRDARDVLEPPARVRPDPFVRSPHALARMAMNEEWIDGDETWTGDLILSGTYVVTGHLTLAAAKVTVPEGATFTMTVSQGASLVIEEATLRSSGTATLITAGRLTVTDSRFEGVDFELRDGPDPILLERSEFIGNLWEGMNLETANATIRASHFDRFRVLVATHCQDCTLPGPGVLFEGNTFVTSFAFGGLVNVRAPSIFRGNAFIGGDQGLEVQCFPCTGGASSVLVDGNVFTSARGVYAAGVARIVNNHFETSEMAVFADPCEFCTSPESPLVEGNVFVGGWQGLFAGPGVVARLNRFERLDVAVGADGDARIESNVFEANRVAGSFEGASTVLVARNLLYANVKGFLCGAEATVRFEENLFDITVFAAYGGTTGITIPNVGSIPGSRCALARNYYNVVAGDPEVVVYGADDTSDPAPASSRPSAAALGMPEDFGPRLPVRVVSASETWTSESVPSRTPAVIVTGQGVSLRITGGTLDLDGGYLGSRQNGTLDVAATAPAWVTFTKGTLLLGHRGSTLQDSLQGVRIVDPSPMQGAIVLSESKARVTDSLIENQQVAILMDVANLANGAKNVLTVERTTFRDTAAGVSGLGLATIRGSTFLDVVLGTVAVLARGPEISSTEFVGGAAAVVAVIAPGGSFAGSSSTAQVAGLLIAIGNGFAVSGSSIEYNAIGVYAIGAGVSGATSNVFHNVVAGILAEAILGIASQVSFTASCGRDDLILAAGGSAATFTPAVSCPHAEPFPYRFTPRVAGGPGNPATITVPDGPLSGPYVAARGGTLLVKDVSIDRGCVTMPCPTGSSFVIGSKLGGTLVIEDATVRNLVVGFSGVSTRMTHAHCTSCQLLSLNPSGQREASGYEPPVGPGIRIERSSLTWSSLGVLHAEGAASITESYLDNTLVTLTDRADLTITRTHVHGGVLRSDPRPNAAPPNFHSRLKIEDSNFPARVVVVMDRDDSWPGAPAEPIDLRRNWWGDPCGTWSETCRGAAVTPATGDESDPPAPPPNTGEPLPEPVNVAPVVHTLSAPATATRIADAAFSATASGIAGVPLVFAWDFGDGDVKEGPAVVHRFAETGAHRVTLNVTDDLGDRASLVRIVQVVNLAPRAFPAREPSGVVYENETVRFIDTSVDDDGEVVQRLWDFGDGATSESASVEHVFAKRGTYPVTLTVWDDDGASASSTLSLKVRSLVNEPPAVDFAWGCFADVPANLCFFDRSTDEDGVVVEWSWDFGDGGVSTARDPRHVFAESGTQTVCLTATDDGGATATRCREALVDDRIVGSVAAVPGHGVDATTLTLTLLWDDGRPAANVLYNLESWPLALPGDVGRQRFSGKTGADGRASHDFHDLGFVNVAGAHAWRFSAATTQGIAGNAESASGEGTYEVRFA